jgi:exopolysaccharide biosynthesis polyprenyl glycosylphosphotransferase
MRERLRPDTWAGEQAEVGVVTLSSAGSSSGSGTESGAEPVVPVLPLQVRGDRSPGGPGVPGGPGDGLALLDRAPQIRDRAVPHTGEPLRRTPVPPVLRLTVVGDLAVGAACAVVAAGRAGLLLTRPGVLAAAFLAGPVLALGLAAVGVYRRQVQGHGPEEFRRFAVAAVTLLAAASTLALALDVRESRALVLFGLPGALAASLGVHVAGRLTVQALHRRGRYRQRVVAMGLERSVAELVRTARRDRAAGIEVVAACVANSRSDLIEDVPVLGRPADVLAVLRVARADAVVLTAWSDVGQEELRRLSWDLEGTGVQLLVAPRLAEVATPRLRIRTVGGMPLLDVAEPEFTGARRWVKTALDYTLAALALIVLAPVLIGVAVAVRLSSPGPVLFRQERVGRHGRHFVMHKFRSMYVDAEERLAALAHLNEGGGPLFKMRDDPRVTPVGRFIRRYSLDELPQLFDVLLGRMSMVGPRPPLPSEVARYAADVRRRLLVKPGLTGLWQVSGRSDLSWEESVRLDLSYVENWFLGLDLSIIARTVSAVLARDGAY